MRNATKQKFFVRLSDRKICSATNSLQRPQFVLSLFPDERLIDFQTGFKKLKISLDSEFFPSE